MGKAVKDTGKLAEPTKMENDYEAEEGYRTLSKAEEIKSKPDLMKRVMVHAHKQKGHAEKITSMDQLKKKIKKRRAEMVGEDESGERLEKE
jgi:hypothetical protein